MVLRCTIFVQQTFTEGPRFFYSDEGMTNIKEND